MAEHQKKRERDRVEENRRMELLKDKRYDILCVLDNSYICDSSSIRKVAGTNYVVVDESIWSKLKIEPKDGSKKRSLAQAPKGNRARKHLDKGVYLPQLAINNLLFCECSNDGEKSLDGATSWDVVQTEMFYIPQASVGDLVSASLLCFTIQFQFYSGDLGSSIKHVILPRRFFLQRMMLNALVTHNRENKIELDLLCEKNAF
uniref:RLR CTR domain-containing protein n=1 Tax=Heterorhabditis bacteriophora TaxID=37862 RepID=A0A1I7WS30_HETBA